VPAPRILQGPFRNVDPHTASLAVYFRGPASELFNMLNPESPGAISALARIRSRACVDAGPAPLRAPRHARVRACVGVRKSYILYGGTGKWNGEVGGTPAGAGDSVGGRCWFSGVPRRNSGALEKQRDVIVINGWTRTWERAVHSGSVPPVHALNCSRLDSTCSAAASLRNLSNFAARSSARFSFDFAPSPLAPRKSRCVVWLAFARKRLFALRARIQPRIHKRGQLRGTTPEAGIKAFSGAVYGQAGVVAEI